MKYRYGSHTVYDIEYHFVWITKYRYQVLTGDVALRVRDLVRQTGEAFEIQILKGVVRNNWGQSKIILNWGWKLHFENLHFCDGCSKALPARLLRNIIK
jgi:hypothetical protein